MLRRTVALALLLTGTPALAQKKIKIRHCAAADAVPALKAGYRAEVMGNFYPQDSATHLVVFGKGAPRVTGRARVEGRKWEGASAIDVTVYLRGAEISVVRTAQEPIRLAIVADDSTIELGPAHEGAFEGPKEFAVLPLTAIASPEAMLKLVTAKRAAFRANQVEVPLDKDHRTELAGLLATLTCGGSI